MATFRITQDRSAILLIEGDDDTYSINKGVRFEVVGDAIYEANTHSGNTLDIRGYLEGDLPLHSMGTGMTVLVAKTGKVRGDDGIGLENDGTIINRGDIRIGEDGIETGTDTRIENFAGIRAEYAIALKSGIVTNHQGGKIIGSEYALVPSNTDGFSVKLINDGLVSSPKWGYYGGEGEDKIINRGKFDGDVTLRGGDDTFDTRTGDFDGTLIGGEGDDVLMTSSNTLRMVEFFGEGSDTVKSTVSYVLNEFVEKLYLLGNKNLSGTGNEGINLLVGNSGNNKLVGLGNNDFLDGKGGNDKLIGGLGDEDNFTFSTGYDQDTISDFEDNIDNIDLEDFKAVASFQDLLDNHTRDTAKGLLIFAGKDKLLIEDMTEIQLDENDVFI